MDMQKYKPLFLSETDEHLSDLEALLVELEKSPKNQELIDEVFRHLHSIKSMSASMGYMPISELSHRMEDLVSPHRDHIFAVSEDEIDLLLQGVDVLRARLQESKTSEVLQAVPKRLIQDLEQLTHGQAELQDPPPEPDHAPEPASIAQDALRISLQVSAQSNMPAIRAFLAHKRLSEIGQVAWSDPGLAQLKAGLLPDLTLQLLLHTERHPDQVATLLEGIPELEQVEVTEQELPEEELPEQAAEDQESPSAPELAPTQPEPQQGEVELASVRVRTELLDFFVDSVGELITLRSYFEEVSTRLDDPALRDGVRRMGAVVSKLRDRVMEVRMVPASLLTGSLPRVCRDVSRSAGKEVSLDIEGHDVELDRALVEALHNPMLHLLRNAIDHGVEPPQDRQALNKDKAGQIKLVISRQQDRVMIRLSDDGSGIDPEKVYSKACRSGIVSQSDQLTDAEKIDLIFKPGLSTRPGVSDISGRGVGLDVVRDALERMGGRVTAETELGHGTSFIMDLPLTLATLQILLIQNGGDLLALPASRVMRASALSPNLMSESSNKPSVSMAGTTLPFVPLSKLIDPQSAEADNNELIVLGSHENPQLAVGVDKVTGHQEVVLKAIGRLLRAVGPYNGSSILGDGRPVLLMDVDALIEKATQLRGEE